MVSPARTCEGTCGKMVRTHLALAPSVPPGEGLEVRGQVFMPRAAFEALDVQLEAVRRAEACETRLEERPLDRWREKLPEGDGQPLPVGLDVLAGGRVLAGRELFGLSARASARAWARRRT